MTITISVDTSQARAWFAKITPEIEKAISDAVNATALEAVGEVKKMIQRGPKTGKVYKRGKGQNLSREHQASAPGEAPATDTGRLVSSVYYEKTGPREATIGSRLAYAAFLEFGTQAIAPRPSWTPAAEKAQPKLKARVEKALAGAVK